jgi:hypothetical protein
LGCSDEELHGLFDRALAVKPSSHELATAPRERMLMTMLNIGG